MLLLCIKFDNINIATFNKSVKITRVDNLYISFFFNILSLLHLNLNINLKIQKSN